jgi:hypothetical protein
MSLDQFLLSADTTDFNYPEIRPTLDLNFARTKTLDPRIAFTRSSGGSYVGADGLIKYAGVNEARFDHNPVTGESLGLLIEETRTNLLGYSNDFSASVQWTNVSAGASIDKNATVAPDGTNTGNLVSNLGQVISLISGSVSVSASSTNDYYATIYAKKRSAPYFTFNCYYVGNAEDNINFNFDTGAVTDTSTGLPYTGDYIFQPVGNGWYRCGFKITRDSTGTKTVLAFRFWESGRGVTTGDTYFWGAQLEQINFPSFGIFPTSYIPTVASTRTRAAEDASITGRNFSSWFNPKQGTVYTNFKTESNISNNIWSINNYPTITFGTINNYFRLLTLSNNIHTQYNVGGINLYPVVAFSPNNPQKISQSYDLAPYRIDSAFNGTFATGQGNIYPLDPGFNQIEFGKNIDFRSAIGKYTLSRLTYWPKKLPNAQLQALTR